MRRLTLVLAACSLLTGIARAESVSASRFTDFFRWSPRVPSDLRVALGHYEKGELLAAAAAVDEGLRAAPRGPFREERLLVRSLALAERGWSHETEEGFLAILESERPSPYYPLALLGLVESRHRDDRIDAVVDAYTRYWETPWRESDRRSRKIRNLLDAYGELRAPGAHLTEAEAALLARPTALARELALSRDRVSERLLYLAGFDLFRAGEYSRSLEALERIGLVSTYFPYALYTRAQDHYALGEVTDAEARIGVLLRFPALTDEERALADRAGLFLVQLLFDTGRPEDALAAARGLHGDGPFAIAARLLRAEIVLSSGEPSLALAFYGDVGDRPLGARLDTERALGVGEAYVKLGDFAAAAASLRSASEGVARVIAALDPGESERLAKLRRLAEDQVRAAAALAEPRRRRIAEGIRRVMALEGPVNVGKLVRIISASHRKTIVGQPVYDLQLLAEAEPVRGGTVSNRPDWIGYLSSRQRPSIEDALRLRIELADEKRPVPSRALAIDALAGIVEGRFPIADGTRGEAERMIRRLLGDDAAAQLSRVRADVLTDLSRGPEPAAPDEDEARRVALRGLDDAIAWGLRRVVAGEGEDLRRLEFELQARLSEAMAHENDAARQRTGAAQ